MQLKERKEGGGNAREKGIKGAWGSLTSHTRTCLRMLPRQSQRSKAIFYVGSKTCHQRIRFIIVAQS